MKDEYNKVIRERLKCGRNIILYGNTGVGKSWTVENEYCKGDAIIERVVFHQYYSYYDFVGQIMPKTTYGCINISYDFVPGPFTNFLKTAYLNPNKECLLIIEEVNSVSTRSVFGDIFQLLDRKDDGSSEYEITNTNIAKIVYNNEKHKVSIPSNMSIICTMNIDESNIPDPSFLRKCSLRLIKNEVRDEESEKEFAETKILDTDITWEHFCTIINQVILYTRTTSTFSNKEKLLGLYFISKEELKYVDGDTRQNSRFAEKVFVYLWCDVVEFHRENIFDLEKVQSIDDIVEVFVSSTKNNRFKIFKEDIYNTLINKNSNK